MDPLTLMKKFPHTYVYNETCDKIRKLWRGRDSPSEIMAALSGSHL
jgi:hypothetical protein